MPPSEDQSHGEIIITGIDAGPGDPPRTGKKRHRLNEHRGTDMMDDLTEVAYEVMDQRPEFQLPSYLLPKEQKPKYRQTGNLAVAAMLQAHIAEIGLKLLFEYEHKQGFARDIHDLLKLFKALKPETKQRLNEVYMHILSKSKVMRVTNLNPDLPQFRHISEVFRVQKDTFVRWRYYAEGGAGPGFSEHMYRANLAVRLVVAEFEIGLADETT